MGILAESALVGWISQSAELSNGKNDKQIRSKAAQLQKKLTNQNNSSKTRLNRAYPGRLRSKYNAKHKTNKSTSNARVRAQADNKIAEYYALLAKILESLGFKEVGGEIFLNKLKRLFYGDETGGKVERLDKVTAQANQSVKTSTIATPPHFSIFQIIDFLGFAYPPTLISAHKKCMSRAIPKCIEKEWNGVTSGSTASGYMTQEMFEVAC